MNDKTVNHPSRERLSEYGLGRLDPNEANDVEAHIADCEQCGETLVNLQDDTFVNLVRRSDALDLKADDAALSEAGDFDLPAALQDHPRYHIVALLGRGGMGDVYKAEHKVMNRLVALKLINRKLVEDPQAVDRFRREVHAAARLSHPNIVTAFDAEQAGESHFLVMEFVDGTDLNALVKRGGPVAVETACDYIRQTAQGLQHAHESGMVHRDIKPHNLMLSPDGRVRILDFGLASFATASARIESEHKAAASEDIAVPRHLTTIGSVMGTPDYMAPEQARDAHSADIRADIYSLGCTLSFLLTGKPPFEGDSAVDKLNAHAKCDSPKLADSRDDVPIELQEVLNRMLAKEPAGRFQTPAEVADALAGFVDRNRTDGGGLVTATDSPDHQDPTLISIALYATGTLSTLGFVLALLVGFIIPTEVLPLWITGAPTWILHWFRFGGLLSLPVGAMVVLLANRSLRRNSHQSALRAAALNVLPLNPFVIVLLPISIWVLLRLKDPSERRRYETRLPLDAADARRNWPIPVAFTLSILIAVYAALFFFGTTTVRFEIEDGSLAARFEDRRISAENDDQTISVKSGRKYRFAVERNGAEVGTYSFKLNKGQKVVVCVLLVDGEISVVPKGANVRIRRSESD